MLASLFVLAIVLAIVAGPFVLFAVKIRAAKHLSPLADRQEQHIAIRNAGRYLLASAGAAVLLLLFSPLTAFLRSSPPYGQEVYFGIADGVPLFCFRLVCVLALFVCAIKGLHYAALAGKGKGNQAFYGKLAVVGGYFSFLSYCTVAAMNALGGLAWGRPLRVGGNIVKPELAPGDDWAHGERPDAGCLDEATRRALEALWLHDAKKEYASVPAFSRLGWQLAALAAPPELLRDIHIAAIQEIDHARKCFALAAGFGEQAQSVLPIPAMLNDTGRITDNPFVLLAKESLCDGCLLEGFNADIAERSALICRDPASLKVIRQIAREERSHAELSWRVLEFCFGRDPARVGPALRREMEVLAKIPRPTAASSQNIASMQAANPAQLEAFGRLPDTQFDAIWQPRVENTKARLQAMLLAAPVGLAVEA